MDNLEKYFAHLCKEKAEKNNGVLKIHKVIHSLYYLKFKFLMFRIWLLLKILLKESQRRLISNLKM